MSDKVVTTELTGLSIALYAERSFSMLYPLTPCCKATGKGLEGGIGCRSCYEYVADMFGDCIEPTEGNREEVINRITCWSADETGVGSYEMSEAALDDLMRKAGILP